MDKLIILRDFIKKYSYKKIGIVCDNENEAKKFHEIAHKLNFHWRSDESYKDLFVFRYHPTCYYLSSGSFSDLSYAEEFNLQTVKFKKFLDDYNLCNYNNIWD